MTQVTQGAYDDELVERYIERAPPGVTAELSRIMHTRDPSMRTNLDELGARDVPMLFAQHEGCMMFTPEGYADAIAAFPRAHTVSMSQKPSASPAFAEALREFCLGL
jgi:hypothetical protein